MSDRYEELAAEAESFRVEKHQPNKAIESCLQALAIGGQQDRQIKQMIGVCYQLLGEYAKALEWYHKARTGATSYEDGNILRDMAESYSGDGQSVKALSCLRQALDKLLYTQYPPEHGATLGFLARTELRMGEVLEAIKHFAVADTILHLEDNRHFKLYNKLHYAAALSLNGQWLKARLIAIAAFRLAIHYGANKHRLRAISILIGGYKLEDFLIRKSRKRHR